MAIDFTKPVTTDAYTTNYSNIISNTTALAQWLDSTNVTITGTPPTYGKRYNRSSAYLEEYSGSVWAQLPMNISGTAGSATTAASGTNSTFYTATSASEGQIGCKFTGQNDVYLYNNGTTWGVTSVSGGAAFSYNRGTTTFTFNGNCTGSAASITGTYSGVISSGQVTTALGYTPTNPAPAGTTELGRYIDFHGTNNATDYDVRLDSGPGTGNTGAGTLTVTAAGGFICSGSVTAYSDRKLKYDLEQIHNALNKVNQLTGYTYSRYGTNNREVGLIAQDVDLVVPEAVVQAPDGTLSLAYGNLVALLVEAIKELRTEVSELKSQVNARN